MKKIKLLTLIVAVGFYLSSMAQFSFGPKFGINLNKLAYNYKESNLEPETKFSVGPVFGILFQYQINEPIGIRTGISISGKGTAYDLEKNSPDSIIYSGWQRLSYNYMEIPLEGTFGINIGEGQIFFDVGPYFGLFITGRNNWKYDVLRKKPDGTNEFIESKNDSRRVKRNNTVTYADLDDDLDYVRVIDYGLNFGVGYRIKFLMINVQYGLGLSNLTPDYTMYTNYRHDWKEYNRIISFNLALMFGKSKD